jgi:hypothetical protein
LNGASAASLYSDTLGSVKGHVSDTVKQEIAGMIAAKLSLKFDSNTGAYTSDVEHDLPTPVVEKMENLAQEDPAALVKYIEELLVDPEQSDVVQAIDDAIVDLQKDVDDFQKIRPENDQLFVVARRAGVNASEITLSQVADVAKVEAAGGDVVATVTTAEIQMFELPNYPATFSAQDINFAAKPDVESALAIKSSELEKVSFATMNREPDMRAFSNPSGMRI